MTSTVDENLKNMDEHDDPENLEFSQINYNLLMSLLDETQVEDCDDEKLSKVIRSLEEEIASDSHCEYDNAARESNFMDCQGWNDESKNHDRPFSQGDIDLDQWMDTETLQPTSPRDGMGSWRMDHHGEVMMMDGVTELGEVNNYSHLYYGVQLDGQDYVSLWHETNVSVSE